MTRPLYDYVLDTIQDEEWLILDTAFANSDNSSNPFLPPAWTNSPASWISRITDKMVNTYKEIT